MAKMPRKTYLDEPVQQPVQSMLSKSTAYTVEDEMARRQAAEQAKIADMSSFSRGLEQGFAGTAEAYHGFNAIRQAILGDEEGADDSGARAQVFAEHAQRYAPEVSSLKDVDSVGDALSFAAGALGQMAPSLATVITGGGAGALIGKRLGQTLLKKQMAKRLKKRGLEVTKQNLGAQGAKYGATKGAFFTGSAIEGGAMGSQLLDPEFEAQSVFGRELSQRERGLMALAGGAVAGRLEALPILGVMRRYGLGKQTGDVLKKTFAGEVGKQALQEGTTEAAQSLVQRSVMAVADQNREVLGEEGYQELLDSFAAGAVGGGVIGGAGRAVSRVAGEQPLAVQPEPIVTDRPDFTVDDQGQARPAPTFGERVESIFNQEIEGFSDADIAAEVFGDTEQNITDYMDFEREGVAPEFATEARPEAQTFDEIDVEQIQAADAERMAGMRSGQVQPNIQYAKVVRDTRGEPIREIPYQAGEQALNRALDKAGVGYEARWYSDVVQEEAQRRYPGDPQAQRDYVENQARVTSETRSAAKYKIQPGQSALDYLDGFRVIQGADTETGTGRGALGAVPGDLALTDDDMTQAYGEIRDEQGKLATKYRKNSLGEKVIDRTELNKERTRRQIIRSYNKDTFNEGFNADKDIRLPGDKVLNAMSLSLAMQPKMNAQQAQREIPLTAKAGEWFAAGLASLSENGTANVDMAKVPDSTVIYQAGRKKITWGQAKQAMGAGQAVPAPKQMTELQQNERDKDLTRDRADIDEIQGEGVEHGTVGKTLVQPIRRDRKGQATQVVMDETQGEKFEAERTGEETRAEARQRQAKIKTALDGVRNSPIAPDGRLAWNPKLARQLVQAGVIEDTKQIFAVPGSKPVKDKSRYKPLKGGQSLRQQRLIKRLEQMGKANVAVAKRTIGNNAVNRSQAVTEDTLAASKAKEAQKNRDRLLGIKREALQQKYPQLEGKLTPKQLELFLPLPPQERSTQRLTKEQKAERAARRKELLAKQDAATQKLLKMVEQEQARKAKKLNEVANQEDLTFGTPQDRPMRKDVYKSWYKDPNSVRKQVEGLIDALAEKLGLTVKLVTPEALNARMQTNPEWAKKVLRGSILGSTFINGDGVRVIYISPKIKNAPLRNAVIAHEIGHAVFKQRFEGASAQIKEAIWRDFETWASQQTNLDEAMRSKQARSLIQAVAFDKTALEDLPPEKRAYVLSFEEWFADQTARYFESAEAPRTIVGKFFKDVADYLKNVFQQMKDEGFEPAHSIRDFYDSLFVDYTDTAQTFSDTVSDLIDDQIRQANFTLSPEQVGQIRRAARAMFRKENLSKSEEADVAKEAALIAKMAGDYGKDLDAAALSNAYRQFLNSGERAAVARAFGTKAMQNRIRQLLREDGAMQAAKQVRQDPDMLIAYGYQLWAAGRLQVGPKTNTMFGRLASRIMKILGIVSSGQQGQKVMEAIQENTHLIRAELGQTSWNFSGPNQLVNNNLQRAVAGVRALGEFVSPAFQAVFQSAYSRMSSTKNPWLRKLAQEFYVPPGSQGVKESFFEAKNKKLAEFHNRVARILQGKDAEFKKKVAQAMASGKWSDDAEVARVQQKLKDFMSDMRTYANKAGVGLGDRSQSDSGYWPWVFDTEALLRDPDAFVQALIATMPEPFVNQYIERFRGQAVLRPKTAPDGSERDVLQRVGPEERKRVAQNILKAILQSKGLGDGSHISDYSASSNTPYMGAHDTRTLFFLAKKPGFEKFLSKDLDTTLISYIDQTVKRSEFARRFDDDGAKIREMMSKARDAGMTVEQNQMAHKFVQAMLGTLGGDIDPTLRKGMSYVMVYENLRLLSMSLFSSLVDPIGIYVRTGNMQDSLLALRTGLKEIATWAKRRKRQEGGKTDARLLAETLGAIEDSIGKEALGYEYGGAYMSGMARTINDKWFEVTGIAGFTRMTRVMATAAAQNFLIRHAQGLDKDSKRYLDELGVTVDDVRVENGKIKILTEEERRTANKRQLESDDRLRNAITRFVDEAILRPDSAQRPIYGSDPHFMLPFHLKGFMYSFYERILKRAWNEAYEHGRLTPMMGLGMYVPGMIAADMLRDAVKDAFGDQDDDRKDDWTVGDWVSQGIDRSGLYGPYITQLDDSIEDYTKWGKFPGLSMAGPAAEHLVDILSMKGGMEAQLARALPGQNLIRPLSNSFMSNFE